MRPTSSSSSRPASPGGPGVAAGIAQPGSAASFASAEGRRQLVASLLLAGAALATLACGGGDPAGEATALPPVVAATAEAVRLELPRRVELQGTVQADQASTVSSRVMAAVTAVHVAAGDTVRRGDVLLEIDPQAAQGQVSQARGALAQAQAALALAERNHQRYLALAETRAASELEVDMARTQLEQARGAVEQARGAVQSASSVASDSRVTAPFAGRVVRRMVDVGDLAAPGRPLLVIESELARRLVLSVPESTMAQARLAVGGILSVAVDTRPDLGVIAGRITEVTSGADHASHAFQVQVELPVADLATGTAGRGWVEIGGRSAVTVPAAAVVRHGGVVYVVVRGDDGATSSRAVTLGGPVGEDGVEVLSGLAGGEQVLVGLAALPPAGSPVTTAPEVRHGGS